MRLRFGLVTVAGLLLAAPFASFAQEVTPPTNEDCQSCHAEPTMTRANGSPVVVDPQAFMQSAHGSFACVDCHSDLATLAEYPHPDDLAPVNCAMCHDDAASLVTGSVHGRAAGGALQCADCHGPPHRLRGSAERDSRTHPANIVGTCGACHGETSAPAARSGPAVAATFADSIHGRLLQRGDTGIAPTCVSCHRSHDIRQKTEPASPVHRLNVPGTCGTCHSGIEQEFHDGIHGELLKANDGRAPNCASCHTAHAITATDTARYQLDAVEQCGTCHREALTTYRDTFHGQVTELGFAPVAKCVDCHQPHQVFPKSDSRSSVAPANLLATCRTCHPSANENFVLYQPHANKDDPERLPILYYASRFMTVLLFGTFGFFGLHSLLWFMREHTGKDDETSRG